MARMNYSTYRKLRKFFKPINKDESARDYFGRLSTYLIELQRGARNKK